MEDKMNVFTVSNEIPYQIGLSFREYNAQKLMAEAEMPMQERLGYSEYFSPAFTLVENRKATVFCAGDGKSMILTRSIMNFQGRILSLTKQVDDFSSAYNKETFKTFKYEHASFFQRLKYLFTEKMK